MKGTILRRIKRRITTGESSFQALILGKPGSGKSFAGLSICSTIDPGFNIARVVFEPKDFLNLINSDIPKGSAILCDEIGSWLSNRDWNTTANKLMSIVVETYRFRQLAVFWTVPHARMTDTVLRNLCNATIEVLFVDKRKNEAETKFKNRTINPLSGKYYDKYPTEINEVGNTVKIVRMGVKKPSQELIDNYLEKKQTHLGEVYRNIENDIGRIRTRLKPPEPNAKCLKCGHKWFTVSKAIHPGCPSCNSRTTTTDI